jgi:hypothetical protein
MHPAFVPSQVASDYHGRCLAAFDSLDERITEAIQFIESVGGVVHPNSFDPDDLADLASMLDAARSAKAALH